MASLEAFAMGVKLSMKSSEEADGVHRLERCCAPGFVAEHVQWPGP